MKMSRMRAGLRFNVGKHGRVYVPIDGKSGGGCLSAFIKLAALICCIGVAAALWERFKVVIIILAVLAAAAFIVFSVVGSRSKNSERVRTDSVAFTVKSDTDEEVIEMLRRITFETAAGHSNLKVRLRRGNGGMRLKINGVDVGGFTPKQSEYLEKAYDEIETLSLSTIYGGGRFPDGTPASYYICGNIKLERKHMVPVFEEPERELPEYVWGEHAGTPCFVNQRGTAHAGRCGVGIYGCTEMTVQEAAAAGCRPCQNCYR